MRMLRRCVRPTARGMGVGLEKRRRRDDEPGSATGVAASRSVSAATSWAVAMAMTAGALAVAFFILARRGRSAGAAARPTSDPGPRTGPSIDWAWQLPMSDGTVVQGKVLERVDRLLIVFSDPSCSPCHTVQAARVVLMAASRRHTGLLVISRGGLEANLHLTDDLGLPAVALQNNFEVATLFGVAGTPGGVLVQQGVIVGGPIAGGAAMLRLVADVTADPANSQTNDNGEAIAVGKGRYATDG